MHTIQRVAEFHTAFNIEDGGTPRVPDTNSHGMLQLFAKKMAVLAAELHIAAEQSHADPCLLRLQLMQEELAEFAEGMVNGDIVECLDALCDLRYVNDGAILNLGLQGVFKEAFEEVHRSNMSKLDANGKPVKNAAGRVVKSVHYMRPNLDPLIGRQTNAP